jgi:DNA-binding NarL/FixJ family response regulator
MQKIRVVVVDDHGLLRDGIASMLRDTGDVEVLATLASAEEAINLPESLYPDVFLMDIVMPGMSGIEATRWIKEQDAAAKVILVSSEVNKDFVSAGIEANIDGYLPKNVDKDLLIKAIRTVMNGEKFFGKEITDLVFHDFYLQKTAGKGLPTKKSNELTKRENQILVEIANGKSLRQIADELFISIKTVETHKLNIQEKLGFSNTAQLVRFAFENKLI